MNPTAAPPPGRGAGEDACRRGPARRRGRWPGPARSRAGRGRCRRGRSGRRRARASAASIPARGRGRSPGRRVDVHLERLVRRRRVELRGVLQQVAHRAFEALPAGRGPTEPSASTRIVAAGAALHPLGGAVGRPRPARRARSALVASRPDRASSTSSSTRWLSSRVSPWTSAMSRSRASGDSSPMRRSTLALVRRLVSGVRSSWAASWTSRSCASRAAASRPSMVLNDAASRPTSSRPSTGTCAVDAAVDADLLGDRRPAARAGG